MKKHLSKAALAAAITTVLSACGGGGSSGGSVPPAATPSTSINGSATKGVVANAPVKVYEVLSGGTLSAAPVATATTDSSGAYTATLGSEYKGGPLKVVISGGAGVTMVCDIPAGCGNGVLFGQTMPLDSTFSLSAAVPAPTGNTVSVHVTPITDIAEKLAEKNGLSSTAISNANDVIRQAFSLGKDITSVKPVDITNADLVAAGDNDAKQIALLSAAILTAVAQQDGLTSLEGALETFYSSVVAGGGLVVNEATSSIISLKDILSAAKTVSDAAKQKAEAEGKAIDLGNSDAVVALLLADAETKTPSDTPTTPQPIDTVTKDNVTKAKELASDLRTIATSASLKSGTVLFGSQIQQAFGDQLDMISTVATSDLSIITTRTAQAVGAIGAAEQAYLSDPTLTQFVQPAADSGAPNDITVTITQPTASGATFAVNQTIGESVVALTSVGVLHVTSGGGVTDFTNGDIALSGSATNSKLKLTITQGHAKLGSLHAVDTTTATGNSSAVDFESVSLDLGASVTQVDTTVANPVTFTGSLSASVDVGNFSGTYTSTNSPLDQLLLYSTETSWTAKKLNVELNGKFSDVQEHSVSANFSATLSNPNGIVFTQNESETAESYCDSFYGYCYEWAVGNSSRTGETPDNYVGVQFSAGLSAQLPGVTSAATIVVDGHRTAYSAGVANATIGFNGKVITIGADSASQQLTITNQDGVTVVGTRPSANAGWSGTLKIGDAQVATLETTNSGIVILRYNDGSFESLM